MAKCELKQIKSQIKEKLISREIFDNALYDLLWKDLIYFIIPIFAVIVVKLIIKEFDTYKFLYSSHFSFAIVMIFASSIPCFIELKVKKQKDTSDFLFLGVQRYILFFIIAVLILSIVIMFEEESIKILFKDKHEVIKWIHNVIVIFNITLFALGIFYTFNRLYQEKRIDYQKKHINTLKSFDEIQRFLRSSIETSYDELSYFIYYLETFNFDMKEDQNGDKNDFRSSDIYHYKEIKCIEDYIRRTKEKIKIAEDTFNQRKKELFAKHKTSYIRADLDT